MTHMKMKKTQWTRSMWRGIAALVGSMVIASPVLASDTEVYARSITMTGANAPVLMMALDTSSNMTNCMANSTSCLDANGNPTYNSRVSTLGRVMQKALFGNTCFPQASSSCTIVKPAPGYLRIGYARVQPGNNAGAWIRFGADRTLDTMASDASLISGTSTLSIAAGVSDAQTAAANATSFTIGDSVVNPSVGLVFTNLPVPKNATIQSATLTFVQSSPNQPSISVQSEASDNANADFTSVAVGSRSYNTAATPSWNSASSTAPSTASIDVTTNVQQVVNRSGWCGGNNLGLLVNSTGLEVTKGSKTTYPPTATVYSYEGAVAAGQAYKPTLTVTYQLDSAFTGSTCAWVPVTNVYAVASGMDDIEFPEGGNSSTSVIGGDPRLNPGAISNGVRNMVGVRFAGVQIPNTARVQSAVLYSTGFSDASSGPAATLSVDGWYVDNLSTFCTLNTSTNAISCSYPDQSSMTTSMTGGTSSFTLPATTNENTNYNVDVTSQVAAIIGRSGWSSGNAMGFRLYNSSTAASASSQVPLSSADANLAKAMMLSITSLQQVTSTSFAKSIRQRLSDELTVFLQSNVGGQSSLGNMYAEVAHYMLGQPVFTTGTFTVNSITYTQPSGRTVISGSNPLTYKTPINSASSNCSANYIYFMSDGAPNDASQVVNNSKAVMSSTSAPYTSCPVSSITTVGKFSGGYSNNMNCMTAAAAVLASGSNSLGKQVRTNAVLFGPSPPDAGLQTDLTNLATNYGGGKYYNANDEASLLASLLDTLSQLINVSGSITAPGVAVNQFSRLTDLDQLYYAVFDPEALHARWRGNVKRYRMLFTSTSAQIVDVNGNPAIDPVSTFFSTTSQSWWSPAVDGNKVYLGGAASVLPAPTARTIYTNVTNAATLENFGTMSSATGTTFMGFSSANQFTNVQNWILGYNIDIVDRTVTPNQITTTSITPTAKLRAELGGVLHSQPVLVNYGYTGTSATAAATDATLQDNTVFFADMEGMTHAINTATGVEVFSFLPRETLLREPTVIIDGTQTLPEFGLDLTPTMYRLDANNDLKITTGTSGDKVYLFQGQRMGGRNYYALDVTNRASPSLKWVINGGTTTNFTNLGQTWSKPVIGQIKVNGVAKNVLFFGGGYDTKHETPGYSSPTSDQDSQGNQFYIVDMETGAILWWASNTASASMNVSQMKWSIPSQVKLFDANNDGFVDAVYFGDLGGQVFRVDINNGNTGNSGIVQRVQLLAKIGQTVTADTADQRRFYEPAGVSEVLDPTTKQPYVVVAMGTGYRSHPLDVNTQDYFYVFNDRDVLRPDILTTTSLQATITPSNLATLDLTSASGVTLTGKMGWQAALPGAGEKVLSSALILFGEVFFTTYIPSSGSTSSCAPVIGNSNLWRMSVTDGSVITDVNKDGVVTSTDRIQSGIVQGLGGSPELIVGQGGQNAILAGTGVSTNKQFAQPGARRIRWYQKVKQ